MASRGGLVLSLAAQFLTLLLFLATFPAAAPVAAQQKTPRWLTLLGNEPAIVAKGGFSGLFPDSSLTAYDFVNVLQLENVILWCDVQMTKDSVGICLSNVDLSNCTDISYNSPYARRKRTVNLNGRNVSGYFTVDFTMNELSNTGLTRPILSRPPDYDGVFLITKVDAFANFTNSLWLNIEHDVFYKGYNISITKYISTLLKTVSIGYISSPEVNFLRNISSSVSSTKTKLIFRIPSLEDVDPSTKQTYNSVLKNLTFIKTFASGILIPKSFIWPTSSSLFLEQYKTIVMDAHKARLEVFASGFANDVQIAYNYSYNPVSEYQKFMDNGIFSIDGFLSDFPSTAREAISCFSHLDNNASVNKTPVVISHNGDSGDYPTCTDMAYQKAIDEGVDVIDCSVQVTKDGILICLSSINLQSSTTISKSPFGTRLSQIPELGGPGIFSFNFTWEEIQQNLKPEISNPYQAAYNLKRNQANQNAGKFMSLSDFLNLADSSNVTGIMITVENAHYLTTKLGYDIINNVVSALEKAGYNNQSRINVLIQSSNSSTLIPFRKNTQYKIVYKLDEVVSNVDTMALKDIQKFAHAVAVKKRSIFPVTRSFVNSRTKVVQTLKSAKLEVYVYVLMNEFVSAPWDYLSDPIYEIKNYVVGAGVDGVITDFPGTSQLYRRSTCTFGVNVPLIEPGLLISTQILPQWALPPAEPPLPSLNDSEVSESPLPVFTLRSPPPPSSSTGPPGPSGPSASPGSNVVPSAALILLATSVGLLLFI